MIKPFKLENISNLKWSNFGGAYTDNGQGFDFENVVTKGIGINNMKRRVRLIGGVLNFNSEPTKGTTLDLFIAEELLK